MTDRKTLTKAQRALLVALNEEPDMSAECAAELEWRSARVLAGDGLIRVLGDPPERLAPGYWFEAIITDEGRSALTGGGSDD